MIVSQALDVEMTWKWLRNVFGLTYQLLTALIYLSTTTILNLKKLQTHLRLIHIYHAMLLRNEIMSLSFDLHNATVFDSHMPCHAPTMPP